MKDEDLIKLIMESLPKGTRIGDVSSALLSLYYPQDTGEDKMKSPFRLDYMSNFKEGTVERMTALRQEFIELEKEIVELYENSECESEDVNVDRVYFTTLSKLEEAQMYSIKLLCILGEKNEG